jgi:hypothetical protein
VNGIVDHLEVSSTEPRLRWPVSGTNRRSQPIADLPRRRGKIRSWPPADRPLSIGEPYNANFATAEVHGALVALIAKFRFRVLKHSSSGRGVCQAGLSLFRFRR